MLNNNYIKRIPLHLFLLLVLFLASLFIFGYIIHEVIISNEEGMDRYVQQFLSKEIVNPGLTAVMKRITFFASTPFLLSAYGILLIWYIFIRKNKRNAVDVALIGISGSLINFILKRVIQRVRPADPLLEQLTNYSFPSGHASIGFIFYGLLAYLVWKENIRPFYKMVIMAFLLLFSLVIGFSRIYLRMHYTSDVIAGFCVGFAWLSLALVVLERARRRREKRSKEA